MLLRSRIVSVLPKINHAARRASRRHQPTALVAALLLAACASSSGNKSSTGIQLASPLPQLSISSGFGLRRGRPHYGVDYAAARGTPVSAAASGTVTFAGRQRGFGRIVTIDHGGGYQTYYAHLSRISVREGKRIKKGQTVGRVGQSGNATGPHLHFELRFNGTPIDPRGSIQR